MVESDPKEPPSPPTPGTISLTSPAILAGYAVVGLVAGWSVRPLSLRLGGVEPRVSWLVIGLVSFLALIVAASAWVTNRSLHRDPLSVSATQAVNRLVMGKTCARVGAVFVGAFLGYAIAQLGISDPAAPGRLLRSLLAASGSGVLLAAALLLERACRVRSGSD